MSLTLSMANALTGLTSAARMAEVVSANLANAMTEGYGRRRVDLSSLDLGGRGGGVRIDGISRLTDQRVLADRRLAGAAEAQATRLSDAALRLEQIVGDADDPSGLAARIAALEGSLIAAGSDPSSEMRLGSSVTRLKDVARAFNEQGAELSAMRNDAEAAIAADVDSLNADLIAIDYLNEMVSRALRTGDDATALMDQRQRVVDRVSEIVPVRSLDRDDGRIALIATGGVVLVDERPAAIGFERRPVVTGDMTFANGLLSGLSVNGTPISPSNGYRKLDGGSLGAAFALRDEILPERSQRLDEMAADLIARFEDANTDPTWSAGLPGLLTDAGAPYDAADLNGLATRIAVNAAVDPDRGGALWRLRDGMAATLPGPAGSGEQIQRWSAALGAGRSLVSGGAPRSAAGHAADLSSLSSGARLSAEDTQAYARARLDTLRSAELSAGVDSDHEMQVLLMVEQAYAANAKVIQTIDTLMKTLMEL